MKTKCIAILIAFCLLIAHASAQPYSIRANRGLNLRTEPSLNASIAETIHSGTVLQVVGKFNRWLKIDRDGREVWLADWVNYSRVDSSEPSGSQQPTAQIDNCCFVNRQCTTNQEWVAGYWAFQRNECPSGQPVAPVSTPAQPADVDNCCFVDRLCQSEKEWLDGYWAYQNGQCAAPSQFQSVTAALPTASELATAGNCCNSVWRCTHENERLQGYYAYQINQCAGLPQTSAITLTGPVPRIEGSDQFVQHFITTLKWMQSIAPDWYNYAITGIDLIVEIPVPFTYLEQSCTARAHSSERKVTVESCWVVPLSQLPFIEADLSYSAAMLAHEACHIHTHAEGKHFASQEDEEAECRKFGTGGSVLINSAVTLGLNPRRGTSYWNKDNALNSLRRFCSQGYRADLFCPTLQKMESIWRNVPFAVFPPGAPEW